MKILIISNLFPPYVLGGYEILCGQVCKLLADKGHSISVLTSNHGLKDNCFVENENFYSNITVNRSLNVYVPFGKRAGLERRKRHKTQRFNYKITKKLIKQDKPDLIFFWSQLRLTIGSARAAQETNIPIAYTFNDMHITSYLQKPAVFGWKPRTLYRYFANHLIFSHITLKGINFDNTTCISRQLKDDLISKGLEISNSKVIYQGIPVENFPLKDNPGSLDSPVKILYVGQLHNYKGVHTLIKAIKKFEEKNGANKISLTIAGDGPSEYKEILKELADKCNSPVSFAGKVSHNSLSEMYRNHNIFVFPSEWPEPFGLTHLEAMASGLPVISTTSGGHGEFLIDNENCLAFEKGNYTELASKLENLINNPELAERLALAGRKVATEDFSLKRYVNDLELFLKNILTRVEK